MRALHHRKATTNLVCGQWDPASSATAGQASSVPAPKLIIPFKCKTRWEFRFNSWEEEEHNVSFSSLAIVCLCDARETAGGREQETGRDDLPAIMIQYSQKGILFGRGRCLWARAISLRSGLVADPSRSEDLTDV